MESFFTDYGDNVKKSNNFLSNESSSGLFSTNGLNNAFSSLAGDGAVNSVDTSLEVINIDKTLDPKKSGEAGNLFNVKNPFDLTTKTNEWLKGALNPLDKIVKGADGKNAGALGGLLVSSSSNGKSISESLSGMVTSSLNLDMSTYLKEIDDKIISEKFPFMDGILSGSLDRFMLPPNGENTWENANEDRVNASLASDRINPLAALGGGILFSNNSQFNFSVDGDRSSWTDATFDALRGQSNEFGSTNGYNPTDSTLSQGGDWMNYFASSLSSNYRAKNETYNSVMELAEAADPYWDKQYRHTIAYDQLQNAKVGGVAFIDGAGDYIKETWDNFGVNARQSVTDSISGINNTLQSYGFDVMINPDLQKSIDKTLDKLGLPKIKGEGMDYEGFPSKEIHYSNMMAINNIEIPPQNFVGYYEEHDYIDGAFPKRILKVKITADLKEKIDLKSITKEKKLQVTLNRFYAFSRSQNYDLFTFDGNAIFRPYEALINYDGIPDISDWKKKSDRTAKQKNKGNVKEYVDEEEILTITLTSPLNVKMGTAKALFSGIPSEEATIESILAESFKLHFFGNDDKATNTSSGAINSFGGGTTLLAGSTSVLPTNTSSGTGSPAASGIMQLALTKPEVSKNLNTLVTPKTFPDMVAYFQKETGGKLFNGGYNIFQDNEIVYVLNKKGPNKIKFEYDWKMTFRFLSSNTMIDTLYTIISRSEQKLVLGLIMDDVMKLGDMSLFNEQKIINVQSGSMVTLPTPASGVIGNAVYQNTHSNTMVESVADIVTAEEFLIRIPNTFAIYRPGDDVKLQFIDSSEEFNGTIKKWAAEQNGEVRAVLLWVTLKKGKETGEDSDIDNNPINRAISKIQETTAKISDSYANSIDQLQAKLTDATQRKSNNTSTANNTNTNIISSNNIGQAIKSYSNGGYENGTTNLNQF